MTTENRFATAAPPDEASAQRAGLVHAAGLGNLRAVYPVARQTRLLVLAVCFILLPIPFLFGAAAAAGLLLGVLLWPLAAMALYKSPIVNHRMARRCVYVHEYGFIHVGQGNSMDAYRWDQISTVYQAIVRTRYNGVSTGTKYLYTITRADGKTVKLTQMFQNIGQLGRDISVRVSDAQLPAVRAALAQGQKLWFGDIFVDSVSVGTQRKAVPWSSVSDVQIRNGLISLVQTGKFLPLTRTRAADVPNLPLFLHLARGMQGRSSR